MELYATAGGDARDGRGAGLPGHLRHRRPRHRAGHRRDEARADRRHAARPGADRARGAQARGEGLPLRQAHHGARHAAAAWARSRCSATATFVGNGRLPLLAPGEEHELGFGVDDAIRVRHALAEEKRGETGIITTSKTDERSYRITVKNLHERAIQVTVLDQIPVSQNADIKVELTGQDGAHQARRRRQARRAGVGHEARAGRGARDRVRLSRHLAGRQEGHLRPGLVASSHHHQRPIHPRSRKPSMARLSGIRFEPRTLWQIPDSFRQGVSFGMRGDYRGAVFPICS